MKRFSKAFDKELNGDLGESSEILGKNKCNKSKYKTGRWTDDEHNRFLEAIDKYGRDWKKVQQFVGTRSSTQSRSHAQKFFKKINLTEVKPGLGLIKHKSLNVSYKGLKKLKVIEEDSSDDEEILICIDNIHTPHPRLRKPAPTLNEEEKLKKSKSVAPQSNVKEFKPENDTYFSPEEEDKKEVKANSEKLMKQPDLLASAPKNAESVRTTAADDSLAKDGKSFDNTNASIHDNELDKHPLVGMKPSQIDSNEEPVNPVKLHISGDEGENDIYKERGLGFGEDNLSCHSEHFNKNTEKIHELDEEKNLGLDGDHFGNNDLEMVFPDKIPHLDNDKAPELHEFEKDYDIKPFGNDVDEFSHHSSILHNEFMERPSAELNYF